MPEMTAQLVRLWPCLSGAEQGVCVNVARSLLEERQELPLNLDADPVDVGSLMPLWNRLPAILW